MSEADPKYCNQRKRFKMARDRERELNRKINTVLFGERFSSASSCFWYKFDIVATNMR